MAQKLSLQQKLQQKLSPQQIQLIQLLEVPTIELEQRIKRELEENPVLELDDSNYDINKDENDETPNTDEFTLEDFVDDDDIPEYKMQMRNSSANDQQYDYTLPESISFQENLSQQLFLLNLNEEELKLAQYLIGNLDEDGYLRRDLLSISDDLIFNLNLEVDEAELEYLLGQLQSLDPPGVAARDLKECLILQLKRKENTSANSLAMDIINKHFDLLSSHAYQRIQKNLHVEQEELRAALDVIHKLNPKPGSTESDRHAKNHLSVIPDFILEYQDGEMVLSMNNQNIPQLRVNEKYLEMLNNLQLQETKTQELTDTLQFVKQNSDNAKWFVEAIQARKMTLLHCMSVILDYQKEYFESGDIAKLRPMILKDIADITKFDISTISRMRHGKYIQTHFGIISLKSLFSEGVERDNGELSSNKVVIQLVQDLIEGEDKSKPYTDEKLTELINKASYTITRRTVSKYREQLGIPVARLRRQL